MDDLPCMIAQLIQALSLALLTCSVPPTQCGLHLGRMPIPDEHIRTHLGPGPFKFLGIFQC
eukprot:scaffold2868_cov348-Pavlova_lutheri.AAC.6